MNTKPIISETTLLNEEALKISHTQFMAPFLMHLITSGDVWAFIGSNHAMTAGRKNPDHALFPYYTQDKIFDMLGSSGSITVIKCENETWVPFQKRLIGSDEISQSVTKSVSGTKICIEEHHKLLNLSLAITWTSSEEFGILREATLLNTAATPVSIEILDGIQNIMTPGIDQLFQNTFSNLTDAYKRSEWLGETLASYSLSSIPTDRAEPNECLTATTVWSSGFPVDAHYLSRDAIQSFMTSSPSDSEYDSRGKTGCYLLKGTLELHPNESHSWWIAADVEQSASDIAQRLQTLQKNKDLEESLLNSAESTTSRLNDMVSKLDGRQVTNLKKKGWRHFSNTLFNMMRGGTFPLGYQIPTDDYRKHVSVRNRIVFKQQKDWLNALPSNLSIIQLKEHVETLNDRNLARITSEYLPLTFSRRHGDPSRPWNRFSIEVTDEHGEETFAYQGNWRDIFQNWEALLHSYPDYTGSVIARFLNTTTFDGYNPYRITQDGFDWEREEPGSPWSNIGYWGDHQIVYLLKLLELYHKTNPQALNAAFSSDKYAYAAVPYRIKPLSDIIKNARSSIEYDHDWSDSIDTRQSKVGADGQLVTYKDGSIIYGNLTEKLLIPLLAKLTNFVPGAGIWMNTQRPEWNDANNALAGYGASMVTTGYMLRYVRFLKERLIETELNGVKLHLPVYNLIIAVSQSMKRSPTFGDNAHGRALILQELGQAGSDFRNKFYESGIEPIHSEIQKPELIQLIERAEAHLQHCLEQNKREDGLYHSYNLLRINSNQSVEVENLPLMLEGQVSILSSGLLSEKDSCRLLNALENSDLYRPDQASYMLYPDRDLPTILEKGVIDPKLINNNQFLQSELNSNRTSIIKRGTDGKVRFDGRFHNSNHLENRLNQLNIDSEEKDAILDIYETTFQHHGFTGRSRSFFAYEGLGSIYWHMVSKLLLAVQEIIVNSEDHESTEQIELIQYFQNIQEGIGVNKTPEDYGAFPIDPYSHTPAHAGVQQPGMTGQVKEDFMVRLTELGVRITNGCISFQPTLINQTEFLNQKSTFQFTDNAGKKQSLQLPKGSFAFTLCNTPIVVTSEEIETSELQLTFSELNLKRSQLSLNREESKQVFGRSNKLTRIELRLAKSLF